jgi:hypothetical protein
MQTHKTHPKQQQPVSPLGSAEQRQQALACDLLLAPGPVRQEPTEIAAFLREPESTRFAIELRVAAHDRAHLSGAASATHRAAANYRRPPPGPQATAAP